MRRELGYIQESDLDLLLVLDARVGGPITRHLLERAGFSPSGEVDSCRSTLSDGRETDVEISWIGGGLVVEDKADADFQPGQPESYAAEVHRRQSEGETVASVLIASSRRLPELELAGARHFSLVITCDELAEVAESSGGELGRAAAIVYRAAEERRPSGVAAEDPVLSAWGDGYRAVIASALPAGASLIVGPQSLRAAGREFAVILLEEAERDLVWKFGHWIPGGHVRMELAPEMEPGEVTEGLRVVPKKVQRWVVADTPPIDFGTPAAQQQDAIEQAVHAALALRAWDELELRQTGSGESACERNEPDRDCRTPSVVWAEMAATTQPRRYSVHGSEDCSRHAPPSVNPQGPGLPGPRQEAWSEDGAGQAAQTISARLRVRRRQSGEVDPLVNDP